MRVTTLLNKSLNLQGLWVTGVRFGNCPASCTWARRQPRPTIWQPRHASRDEAVGPRDATKAMRPPWLRRRSVETAVHGELSHPAPNCSRATSSSKSVSFRPARLPESPQSAA